MPVRVKIEPLREFIDRSETRAPAVSSWSVGMHIEHCCLAMSSVCDALAGSVPPPPREGFSLLRFIVLRTGYIPRGRGKAPRVVTPTRQADVQELRALVEKAESDLRAASGLSGETWFRHFAFGVLNRDQSLRFLAIHNAHHVRIIRDVLDKVEARG